MEAILTQCAMAKAATPVSGSYKKNNESNVIWKSTPRLTNTFPHSLMKSETYALIAEFRNF